MIEIWIIIASACLPGSANCHLDANTLEAPLGKELQNCERVLGELKESCEMEFNAAITKCERTLNTVREEWPLAVPGLVIGEKSRCEIRNKPKKEKKKEK